MVYRPRQSHPNFPRQAGFSYVELLIAAVIVAISVLPVSEALHSSLRVANADIEATGNHYRLVARLETVLAESYFTLAAAAKGPDTESLYSDAVATPDRLRVYIAEYDADNADLDDDVFTGVEADLLWIEVDIEGSPMSLSALKSAL